MNNPDAQLPLATAASGDEQAFAVIAQRMQPLIGRTIQPFIAMGLDPDDVAQEASLGLLAAVRAYRPDGGASFTTFATTCIRNRLVSVARRHGAQVRVEESLSEDDASALDPSGDPAAQLLERESLSHLQDQLRRRLTDLEYRVLLARLSDLSYEEIAHTLGVSKKTVDNAVQRLRRKMTAEQ